MKLEYYAESQKYSTYKFVIVRNKNMKLSEYILHYTSIIKYIGK